MVRCCRNALANGPIGQHQQPDFYAEFISCEQETSPARQQSVAAVKTSCAMFVRAVRHWCGAARTGPYKPGTGMFITMGKVGFAHPAFVPYTPGTSPNPGDYFYISSKKDSNDGHTGIFLAAREDGSWETAEGGGGDGTTCRTRVRQLLVDRFADNHRTLWGWFDVTAVGLPESPVEEAVPENIA